MRSVGLLLSEVKGIGCGISTKLMTFSDSGWMRRQPSSFHGSDQSNGNGPLLLDLFKEPDCLGVRLAAVELAEALLEKQLIVRG